MTMEEQHELSRDMLIELRRLSSVFHQANLEAPKEYRNNAILAGLVMVTIEQGIDKMEMVEQELIAKFIMSVTLHDIAKDFGK